MAKKNLLENDEITDYGILVEQEISNINAFKDARSMLISQYGNIIDKLYENAPFIILIGDFSNDNSYFVYVNKFIEKVLAYSPNELIQGGSKFFQSLIYLEDLNEFIKDFSIFKNNLLNLPIEESENEILEKNLRIKHKDGIYFWFNLRTIILTRKNDNTPHLLLTILSNINDSVELQEQKQKALNLEIKLLKEKVESQNEQLQTHLLSSIENEKCYTDIVKFIKYISSSLSEKEQIHFKQVINYISRNRPETNTWEEFIKKFHIINPNFVQLLSSKYKSLTPTEIKICSLTRVGLNSKDISSILKLSLRSVENHKYNIRRKFNLEPYQNLYNHINSIE